VSRQREDAPGARLYDSVLRRVERSKTDYVLDGCHG
jgi:hypothetical protein